MVDDGSTDSSLVICNEYAQKDDRITVLSQQNQGAGSARNKGIKESQSEFVIFLDSDDYYPENDILEELYNNAKKHNVLICGGSFSSLCNDIVNQKYNGTFTGYTFAEDGIVEYRNYQFDYGYHRFIYNKDFLILNNIYFPDYKRYQDPPFLVKAMYMAKKFFAISKVTYLLRSGHKNVNWTKEKKEDLLSGIIDNLAFAKIYKLEKLYYLTYERLNQHAAAFNMFDVFNIRLKKILNSLDYDVIHKYNPNFKLSSKFNFSKNILQNIFSVKNDKDNKHKKIRVLGVTIKLKKTNNKNNKIYLVDEKQNRKKVKKIKGLTVIFSGKNGIVEIGCNPLIKFKNAKIYAGNNAYVSIGSSKYQANFNIVALSDNSKVIIGDDFSCEKMYLANRDEPNLRIEVGKDCMFSSEIYIRSSDGHTIVDLDKNVINKPNDIKIGDHVWVCNSAKILKNVQIPDNCIVANSAIVTGVFQESNCIIAGLPAKIIKRNVNWDRKNTYKFKRG